MQSIFLALLLAIIGSMLIGTSSGFINFAVIENNTLSSFFELLDSGIELPVIENPKILPSLLLCN